MHGALPAHAGAKPTATNLPRRLTRALCLDDFEAMARAHLPRPIFGYVAGAAERNASLDDNERACKEWGFVPRILRDVSKRDPSVELFGRRWSAPFGIAPMGMAALVAYRGDVVQRAITFNQNNRFFANTYIGPWRFMPFDTGTVLTFNQWRSAPYNQDGYSSAS